VKRFGAISGLRARLLPMNKLRLVATDQRALLATLQSQSFTGSPVATGTGRNLIGPPGFGVSCEPNFPYQFVAGERWLTCKRTGECGIGGGN